MYNNHFLMVQWLVIFGFVLVSSSKIDADHWSRWFNPGFKLGGNRNLYPSAKIPTYSYRANRRETDDNNLFEDAVSLQNDDENQKVNLMELLRVLAAASSDPEDKYVLENLRALSYRK